MYDCVGAAACLPATPLANRWGYKRSLGLRMPCRWGVFRSEVAKRRVQLSKRSECPSLPHQYRVLLLSGHFMRYVTSALVRCRIDGL
jgi:hypothetical protein